MGDFQAVQWFCLSDSDFFDTPDRVQDGATRFPLGTDQPPPGWDRRTSGWWTALHPVGAVLPEQGWKLHVAALPENAADILERVSQVCIRRRAAFKFLRSRRAVSLSVGKHWPRSSSGKFITVYPADDEQLADLVADLTAAVNGSPAPYLLGDLRLQDGPVHVRYGGFVDLRCPGPDGRPVLAVRDPSGELVPDVRGPVFRPPAWAPRPACLAEHLDRSPAPGLGEIPYRVVRALHFTAAGGLYLADDVRTGRRVVLREARPHAGSDGLDDAITRLRREYDALCRVQDLGVTPRPLDRLTVWEHEFVVEEYVEGQTLMWAMIDRYPLVHLDSTSETVDRYLTWVRSVMSALTAAVGALHARGLCFRDLHPENVIVRPDGSVVLVDLEYAAAADRTDLPPVGAAGYTCGAGVSGAEADRYALRAIWRTLLLPVPELVTFDPDKAVTLEGVIRTRFPAVAADLDALPAPVRPPGAAAPAGRAQSPAGGPAGEDRLQALFEAADWTAVEEGLLTGILRTATPERTDRLFPGDTAVYDGQSGGLAHGAAGVLHALHTCGVPVPPEWVDWLARAARRPPGAARHGLLDGAHGAAVVLAQLGRPGSALEIVEEALDRPDPVVGAAAGLAEGAAGVALARLHFAVLTGDDRLRAAADRTARRLDALTRGTDAGGLVLPQHPGLLDGLAGAAALHLQLFRVTGELHHLDACRRALLHDVRACEPAPDGSLLVRRGSRRLGYLGHGSSGIALVADAYLADRDRQHAPGAGAEQDAELAAFVRSARRVTGIEFTREPGLFHGRAGLLAAAALLGAPADCAGQQARRLAWHLVHRDGALMTPGRQLRRLSADLATGSAGLLVALRFLRRADADVLPLVPRRAGRPIGHGAVLAGAGAP